MLPQPTAHTHTAPGHEATRVGGCAGSNPGTRGAKARVATPALLRAGDGAGEGDPEFVVVCAPPSLPPLHPQSLLSGPGSGEVWPRRLGALVVGGALPVLLSPSLSLTEGHQRGLEARGSVETVGTGSPVVSGLGPHSAGERPPHVGARASAFPVCLSRAKRTRIPDLQRCLG